MLSDSEYELMTRKIVVYLLREKAAKFLKNTEYMYEIKHNIMIGDWKYQPTNKVSIRTCRINRAKWAIYKIYNKLVNIKEVYDVEKLKNTPYISQENPISEQTINDIKENIKFSNKEKRYIDMLLEGKTMKQIAQENSVTKQSVYMIKDKIKAKIQKYYAKT